MEEQLARLPIRGAAVASPCRDEANLKNVLLKLCPAHPFDDSTVRHWYEMLSSVVGQGLSEQQRLEVSPVAKRLRSTGLALDEIARTLQGHVTGFHTDLEVEVVSQIKNYLALDPTVGSVDNADENINSLRHAASIVARACLTAASDLAGQRGTPGRGRLEWHDDFTQLLLNVAETASIEPTLGFDRINNSGCGWLFEAAQALQSFLWPGMGAQSDEAAVKRLERSKKRLQLRRGQNHPRD
jgi:hypothetical protein